MNAREHLSISNLLALSQEKADFAVAVREWEFTGDIHEYPECDAKCELCEHKGLRYHFQIGNAIGSRMNVGSECIKKFDIQVNDAHGKAITGDVVRYLHGLVRDKRRKEAMQQLLSTRSTKDMHGYSRKELDEDCYVSLIIEGIKPDAKMVNYLFLRFEEEKIPFEPKDFSVSSKTYEDKTKLLALKPHQFKRIIPALSKKQIQYYQNSKEF